MQTSITSPSVVLAAASVPRALLMLLGGAVGDRFSPRTSMLAGGLARALVMGALAALGPALGGVLVASIGASAALAARLAWLR